MMFLRDGYRDGTTQNGYWRTMADVESFEVLKGPGSALYGANGGPGGSINLTSKKPDARFGAELSAFAGAYNTHGVTGDVTGRLHSAITGRAIINFEKSDGYRGLARDISEFSPGVDMTYAPRKLLTLHYDYRDIKVIPDNLGIVHGFDRQITPGSSERRYYTPLNKAQQQINRFTLAHSWNLTDTLTMKSALINDERKLYLLRNVTGNVTAALPFTYMARAAREQNDKARFTTLQNEWIWKTRTGSIGHTILGGIEYNMQRMDTLRRNYTLPNILDIRNPVAPENTLVGLASVLNFNRTLSADTTSLYVQDQIEFSPQWQAIVGVRYDHFELDLVNRLLPEGNADRHLSNTDNLVSPRVGLVYKPVEPVSLYASYSNAHLPRAGEQLTSLSPGNRSLAPEAFSNYELGAKWDVMPALALTVAAYQLERSNAQVPTNTPGVSVLLDGLVTQGVEVGLGGNVTEAWSVMGGYAYQNGEIKGTSSGPTLEPAQLPRNSASLWNRYDVSPMWGVGLGAVYRGDMFASTSNQVTLKGYTRFDAAVFLTFNRNLQMQLNVENLFDKKYYASSHNDNNITPGSPRAFYLSANFTF